jgi:hypothetical protein
MFDVFIMDMGGNDDNVAVLTTRFPHAQVVRYYDNHLDTLKRCVSRARTPFCWVISSCCDYEFFDFDYRAVPWEAYQIHCWASGKQQQGDTFLVPVAEFKRQQAVERLEWYKDINWHSDGVMRLPWPTVEYSSDNLIETIKDTQFNTPYILFKRDIDYNSIDYSPNLWKNRSVHTFNKANSVLLVPREVLGPLESQIYDYPFITKQKEWFLGDKRLDIIHVSNGEVDAEKWYNHLVSATNNKDTGIIKRVKDINDRSAAFKIAASMSTTDWFFKIPAKLKIDPNFDWTWQPDYLQRPKHYIFYAKNPVNGLQYGHMAIVAYNKKLVLETQNDNLDFTLSQPHEVVPVISGIAYYNSDPLMTWRTAFREVIKLIDDVKKTGNIESQYRLGIWLTVAQGPNSDWSIRGAQDATEYYKQVNGDYSKLMLSFSWEWLHKYYSEKYLSP